MHQQLLLPCSPLKNTQKVKVELIGAQQSMVKVEGTMNQSDVTHELNELIKWSWAMEDALCILVPILKYLDTEDALWIE